jgi:hypothetical protein
MKNSSNAVIPSYETEDARTIKATSNKPVMKNSSNDVIPSYETEDAVIPDLSSSSSYSDHPPELSALPVPTKYHTRRSPSS